MKGSVVLLNGNEPKGRFVECIISGTPAPGMAAEMVPATEPVNGRYTYRYAQTGSNGDFRPNCVFLEDAEQGVVPDSAGANTYTSGRRGFVYYPVPGDELNLLVKNISGTSDSFAIGAKLTADVSTGKFIAATGTRSPWEVMETVAALTADAMVACRFL